ncbi:MAG: hypothetical protein H6738_25290 [Alphaproteobacteria bacterium]|nr:hypothetical protein [Alphaproteobacteria bacterium]
MDLVRPFKGDVEFILYMEPPKGASVSMVDLGAEVRNGRLYVYDTVPDSLHKGWVAIPRYHRADVSWKLEADGTFTCPPVHLRPAAVVEGTITPPPPAHRRGGLLVVGCGGATTVADDGSFHLEAEPGRCTLAVSYSICGAEGKTYTASDPVAVTPRMDEDITVQLTLPATWEW